jgi:outer membrane protein assembly factor BamD
MQSYALYKNGDYDDAVDVLDIFIKLHPRHEHVVYAYYMQALSNYVQISESNLDQSRTKLAKVGFEQVMRRFPGTKYANDSSLKIDLVNDHLAGQDMLVGRYYLKNRNPIAAIKRFQIVLDKYQTTSHISEALHRLVESNLMLGLKIEAKKYSEVLKHNYPDTKWSKYSERLIN